MRFIINETSQTFAAVTKLEHTQRQFNQYDINTKMLTNLPSLIPQ